MTYAWLTHDIIMVTQIKKGLLKKQEEVKGLYSYDYAIIQARLI